MLPAFFKNASDRILPNQKNGTLELAQFNCFNDRVAWLFVIYCI